MTVVDAVGAGAATFAAACAAAAAASSTTGDAVTVVVVDVVVVVTIDRGDCGRRRFRVLRTGRVVGEAHAR